MQRKDIRIFGKVQGVGLRVNVKAIADKIGIQGTVKNMDDGSVLVVCEADHNKIEEMVRQIRDVGEPAVVKGIQVGEGFPATNMKGFKVLFDDTDTEMLTAISTGTAVLRDISKTLVHMKHTQDEMKHTQDEMKHTQDEMKHTQDDIKNAVKSMDGKMDSSLENDAQILDILKGMRDDRLLSVTK